MCAVWQGNVVSLHIATEAAAPTHVVTEVRAVRVRV
jgi:hypothetical protein